MHLHLISFQPLRLKCIALLSSETQSHHWNTRTFRSSSFHTFSLANREIWAWKLNGGTAFHQGELKQRLMSRAWPCGEIVSPFFSRVFSQAFRPCPTFLLQPLRIQSLQDIFLQALVPPVQDLDSPPAWHSLTPLDLKLPLPPPLTTQGEVTAVSEVTLPGQGETDCIYWKSLKVFHHY